MNVDKDDKSALPEATSTSHKRNKVKPRAVPGADTSMSKKSKLGKDISNDNNVLSESKDQIPFADRTWKRKQKSMKVSLVYSLIVLSCTFYFVFGLLIISQNISFTQNKHFLLVIVYHDLFPYLIRISSLILA
jgi:hypothetical protein